MEKHWAFFFFSCVVLFSRAFGFWRTRTRVSCKSSCKSTLRLGKLPHSSVRGKKASLWSGRRWTHFSFHAVVDWRRALFGCLQAAHFKSARFPLISRTTSKRYRNLSPSPVAPGRTEDHWSCKRAALRENFSSFLKGSHRLLPLRKTGLLFERFRLRDVTSLKHTGEESWHDAQSTSFCLRVDGAAEGEV